MDNIAVLRCDASNQIGLGHIFRCLVLADQLKSAGYNVTFVSDKKNKGYLAKIPIKNFPVLIIDTQYNYKSEMNDIIDNELVRLLVIDVKHNFPIEVIDECRKKNIVTIALDNKSKFSEKCDICFFPPHACFQYENYIGKIYQGLEYVLLRNEFIFPQRLFKKQPDKIDNVFLMPGGTDPGKLCTKLINLLLQNYGHKIKIHALRSQVEQKKIRFFVDKKNVFLHEEIFNMPYFLQRIDYSIITFGMAAYEMLVMGIPATHICRNAEDIEASKWFQEKGYARSVCTSEINKVNLIDTSSKIGKRVSYKPEVIRVIEEHMKRNLN